ncbi:MAG TPA: SpoIIE family protein phosphatase [Bacteroidota bacterium]|nr:SpoIIE family protein phosphatase [Bacteroidota bacterium]
MNATLDVDFILKHFLFTIMGKILSSRGVVLLRRSSGSFSRAIAKGFSDDAFVEELRIPSVPSGLIDVSHSGARKLRWLKGFRDQNLQLVLPLRALDTTLGVAAFNLMVPGKKLTGKEQTYMKAVGNIAASAIEKGLAVEEIRQVNRRLDAKVQELNTLFDLSKEFSLVLESDRLLRLLIFSLLGRVAPKRYFIALKRDETIRMAQSKIDKPLDDRVVEELRSIASAVMIDKPGRSISKTTQAQMIEAGIQVLVPIQLHNETKGVLGVGERLSKEPYAQADIEFLTSLGSLAIVSIENARLFHEAIEKQKLEDELLIAREIQKGLLPARLPKIKRYDVAATNLSSKQVGGDYYDLIQLSDHRFMIAIGDVSGKGTPASLLMANLQATIRALIPLGLSLAELTRRVNDLIFASTGIDRFITFFWGILDTETKTFRYVSAGHNPPLLFRRDGTIERLDLGGVILGIMRAVVPYQEGEVPIDKDESLVLYTDGVTEAMSKAGAEFEEFRLIDVVTKSLNGSADAMLSAVVASVQKFSEGVPQSDDITVIVLKGV